MVTWPPPAPHGQISTPLGHPCGQPLVLSVFSPLFGIYALGFTTRCIRKLNLLLKRWQWILAIFRHFCCFCRVWGGDALLLRCWQTPRHKTVCILGIEIVLYMFLYSRIAHWQGLSATNMGFCHFLVIFCSLGVHSQPPRAQQFLLSPDSHSHPTSE